MIATTMAADMTRCTVISSKRHLAYGVPRIVAARGAAVRRGSEPTEQVRLLALVLLGA